MLIFPAIDLFEGKAVRLYKGDYNQKTVYNDDPLSVAFDFKQHGAKYIHIVDLEGAKTGTTPNFDTVCKIKETTGMFCEIGGGIRDIFVVQKYISSGLDRVILGTSAVNNRTFLKDAVKKYGDKIAVGIDIKNGFVATHGWTENSGIDAIEFCREMVNTGVKTIICTDISKDGAMMGTNRDLYKKLNSMFDVDITASGGVSTLEDIVALKSMGMYGAIIGKAYYTGAVSIKKAVEVAK